MLYAGVEILSELIERLSDTGVLEFDDRIKYSCCLQSSESSKDAEVRFRLAFEDARKVLMAPSVTCCLVAVLVSSKR